MGVGDCEVGAMDESLSLENLEAIEELVWTLNASRGEFALVIVRCNYAQLRDRAIVALCEQVENVVVWAMPSETTALLEGIRECGVTDETAAVLVTGLEGARELDELLSSTNRIREEFRSDCPFPVVLWVTDAGLKRLMRSAPDFESWGTTTHLEIAFNDLMQWMNARIHEWSTGELSCRLLSQIEWTNLEKELLYTEERLKEDNAIFSEEFTLCWSAILGSVYHAQWKTDKAITSFETALRLWNDGVWPIGKARVLEELIRSYHINSLRHRDRSHPSWKRFREAVDKYLGFYELHYPDLLASHIPFFLGDILVSLERWDVLHPIALKSSKMSNLHNSLVARPYGFLAEVAANAEDWAGVLVQAHQALTKLELAKNFDDFKKPIPPSSFNPEHHIVIVDEAWYKTLIAKAKVNLGDPGESIKLLEEVRLDLRTMRHSLRHLQGGFIQRKDKLCRAY